MTRARTDSLLAVVVILAAVVLVSGCGGAAPGDDEGASRSDATGSEIFNGNGVWVVSPTATFPATGFGPMLKSKGFTWVALQIGDGANVLDEASWAAWIAAWRNFVPHVGAWGVNREDPVGEANLMADKVAAYGFDFYIADAEAEYKYSQDSGFCSDCFSRSVWFIDAFRAKLPDLTAAVSSYGRVDYADLDWRAWSNAGFDFLPQAYWNDDAIYQPSECVKAALEWIRPGGDGAPFFDADRVHPTFGLWGGGKLGPVPAEKYMSDFGTAEAEFGTQGFSVYRGDMCPSDEWAVLGADAPPTGGGSTSGGGSGGPCSDACSPGAKECVDGNRYVECGDFNGDGCTEWSSSYSCGVSWPGTTCSAGYCVGSSGGGTGTGGGSCDACTPGSKQCVDGDVYQDCGDFDGDGCAEWSTPYSCKASWPTTHCNDGWCVN